MAERRWERVRGTYPDTTGRTVVRDNDAAGNARAKYLDDSGLAGWTIDGPGVDLDAMAADWIDNAALTALTLVID